MTNALVEQEFLTKDVRGGRLLPGPKFGPKRLRAPSIPAELLEALSKAVELKVSRVPMGSALVPEGVVSDDCLVLAPADRTDLFALTPKMRFSADGEFLDPVITESDLPKAIQRAEKRCPKSENRKLTA